MPVLLANLLARYGYAIVFLGVFLESAGVPVPGETVLLAAGFFASQGTFALPWVIGLGIGAAILGDNVGYWIGRRAGRPLVERYGRLVGLTPGRIAAFDAFFQRHGARTVFLARFVTGLRVVAALFAGVARLPWSEFLLYNAAGALVWATTVTLAGYFFGRSWELLHRWFGRAALFGAALAIALVVVALARRFGGPLFASVVAKLPASLARRELAFAAASLGFVAVFTKIAEDVITKESTAFDHGASLTLHAFANPVLDRLMHVVSDIGSAPVVSAIVGAVIVWCLLRKEARAAAALAGTALATEGLNLVLKLAFQRTRPSLWELATLHSYSFPSGHAMAALAIYGMVAVIVARRWPRLRWPIMMGACVMIVAIGVSRVYLGHHWATDVLAGYAAGAFILAGGVYVLERVARSPSDR